MHTVEKMHLRSWPAMLFSGPPSSAENLKYSYYNMHEICKYIYHSICVIVSKSISVEFFKNFLPYSSQTSNFQKDHFYRFLKFGPFSAINNDFISYPNKTVNFLLEAEFSQLSKKVNKSIKCFL